MMLNTRDVPQAHGAAGAGTLDSGAVNCSTFGTMTSTPTSARGAKVASQFVVRARSRATEEYPSDTRRSRRYSASGSDETLPVDLIFPVTG
ncbi:MAG: hypothetical protein U5O39_00440 [Gammaproteobacteria bacterium]|nr:hypothetical protein [Gammaproteobacteria bacterium]